MQTRRKEKAETNRARQQRLRERRKEQGFKRVTIWLSPEQVDTLESFGGEPWLGTTVKTFLEQAVAEHTRQPTKQAGLFALAGTDTGPELLALRDNAKPATDNDKAALWREADSLNASGMKWEAIARQWNEQGRRTSNGAEYRGANIAREVRKWKGGTGNEC